MVFRSAWKTWILNICKTLAKLNVTVMNEPKLSITWNWQQWNWIYRKVTHNASFNQSKCDLWSRSVNMPIRWSDDIIKLTFLRCHGHECFYLAILIDHQNNIKIYCRVYFRISLKRGQTHCGEFQEGANPNPKGGGGKSTPLPPPPEITLYCIILLCKLPEEYDSLMTEYKGCKQWYIHTAYVFRHKAFQITYWQCSLCS